MDMLEELAKVWYDYAKRFDTYTVKWYTWETFGEFGSQRQMHMTQDVSTKWQAETLARSLKEKSYAQNVRIETNTVDKG